MEIDITEIKRGLPGITPVAAQQLYEAFEVCMHLSEHDESVTLPVHGIREEEIYLHWEDGYNDQKSRAYADIMNRRCASKTEQATQSDGMKLPAYISVIEFGSPKALYVKKTL